MWNLMIQKYGSGNLMTSLPNFWGTEPPFSLTFLIPLRAHPRPILCPLLGLEGSVWEVYKTQMLLQSSN